MAEQENRQEMEPEVPAKGGVCGPKCASRYLLASLLSIGMGIIYGLKVGLHVVIVAMVNNTALAKGEVHHGSSSCGPANASTHEASSQPNGPFLWDQTVQGWLLSSYFYGYLIAEFPGGYLSENFSARWVFFTAVLINIVCTLLSPILSTMHWGALLVMRVMQGFGGGMTFPAAHCMLAHWAPPMERSVMSNIVYSGTALGTVLFMLLAGVIAGALSWEWVFYILGAICTLWLVFWVWLSVDMPQKQKRISPEERALIVDSLKAETAATGHSHPHTPWKKVFTSGPFLAILIAHTCGNWGWYMVLIELPQYMTHVLNFDISKKPYLTAIPFLTMWLFSMLLSKIADTLRSKKLISTTWVRKIATLISSVIPTLCLIGLCFIECDKWLAYALMTITITSIGGMFSGYLSNHIDIAPNFAGTLMAITNTAATIPGITVPIIVGQLTHANPGIDSWRIVFGSTIALYVVLILVYSFLASGDVQEWNNIQ